MTFIGGLRHDGMTAPWLLDGPIDGPAFILVSKPGWHRPSMRVMLLYWTTSRLTKSPQHKRPSKSAVHDCCSCRHIHQT